MTSTNRRLLTVATVAALAAVIAVAALAATVAAAAGESRAARGAGIVYAKGLELNAETYVRTPAGQARRLPSNRAYDGFPSWSPDRKRIVFPSDRAKRGYSNIYVIGADGKNVKRLTTGTGQDLYPAWSPDGRRIAFSSIRAGAEAEIYVMNADGSNPKRLTRTPKWADDTAPRFSPDGRWIVFSSNRVAFANYEIFRMRASDGGAVKRLTVYGGDAPGDPGDDLLPLYSPDGKRIAFVSDREPRYGIWTMNANGGDVRKVITYEKLNTVFPRYSRDGKQILYGVFDPNGVDLSDATLRVVYADGRGDAQILAGREADW